ncbi:DegT/DnrJ/EryC1/StrS family aminotransferase [Erysipelothrix rhusiopathiae]|uniref:DegT/DnrJ/EryC1/StrS family aminotransferase n=1 Tax=Erysipelothrix rhusiopathiae TaxID=1648 RepID=UPI003BF584B8
MKNRNIPFSPPDISEKEIELVVEAMRSGWITTGPKTKQFESQLAEYCSTDRVVTMNSATAAMEMTLRLLGVGPGDEVITSAYTYTASASVIHHVGAKIVLVDIQDGKPEMNYKLLEEAITEKTKVIIPVDIAGIMCDYDEIFKIVERKKDLFEPNNELQSSFGRIIVMADAAHSFGAKYKGKMSGEVADFTAFSFHAVKNLTTAEGGAVTWRNQKFINNEDLYKEYMLLILHGQSKDALAKNVPGSWEYDIIAPNYKCNMTDIQAAIGISQLERYDDILEVRNHLVNSYNEQIDREFKNILHLDHSNEYQNSSSHLYFIRIDGINEEERNSIIIKLAERGISTNVHYKPLPLLTAYKNLGFEINDYPAAYNYYQNEITLPLNSLMVLEDVEYVVNNLVEVLND